jgi:hypothetical protein
MQRRCCFSECASAVNRVQDRKNFKRKLYRHRRCVLSCCYPLIAVSANIEQFSAVLALTWGHASAIRWKEPMLSH